MADKIYPNNDLTAPSASGSFITNGMIIVPCTIKTLSGIASSYSENLLVRVAEVERWGEQE
jgi:4-hydroxy-3-polyprenylbenzoate decarboxylase